MAVKKDAVTYSQLVAEVRRKEFRPIYVLMGDEAYYIDDLEEKIVDAALSEDERAFNLTVCYGVDADVREVISTCKRYPMMAERQVVVLREAQNIDSNNAELFKFYAQSPMPSTVLVICCKNGNFKAPEFLKLVKSGGVGAVFESKRLDERNVWKVIVDFVQAHGCKIDGKATAMLKDYVGVDVSRLVNEVGKLVILLNVGDTITPEMIERNIGISKDYNNFELENAIRSRNAAKAFEIVDYFSKNPKNNPSVLTVSVLFSFFSLLLLAHTSKVKSVEGVMAQIDTKSQYRAGIFIDAMRYYSTANCVNIIGYIRDFDRKAKGMQSRQNEYDLLRELVFKILYS